MNCDQYDNGCSGGHVSQAFRHLSESGVDLLNCTAYRSGKTGNIENCTKQCDDPSTPYELFYVDTWREIHDVNKTAEQMVEIMKKV
jgi:hypothetical protein